MNKPYSINRSADGQYYTVFKAGNNEPDQNSELLKHKESAIVNIQSQVRTVGKILGLDETSNSIIASFSSRSFDTISDFTEDNTI